VGIGFCDWSIVRKSDLEAIGFAGLHYIDRYLVFRDQLRQNPVDRIRYERVKRTLAEREWEEMNTYADAKSEVVEEIIKKGFRALAPLKPNLTKGR
jgi:GrpB-like predicted nucleotidyltransferase (UPF0157 family)